ncbi:MAG: 4Fe-4S binding protein [Desulfurococcaceae archaeon]
MKVVKPIGDQKLPLSNPVIGVAGKTGMWRYVKPIVNVNKCTRCYQCEIYCPVNSIRVEQDTGAVINYDYCKGCGICADTCPVNAILMVPEVSE